LKVVTKVAVLAGSLLFLTGGAVAVGATNGVQMKHERIVGGAGKVGNTGTGGSLSKVAENGGVPKRPCHAHEGQRKKNCVKVYRENQRRSKMKWPPNPSVKEIQDRIGMDQWRKAERVAYCETGGNWQHFPNGSYIGGLGMYRQTYGYGQRVTGYRWVSEGATKQEQIAIAIASFPITYGWSGWGCGGA
jgi:hypothetical protein